MLIVNRLGAIIDVRMLLRSRPLYVFVAGLPFVLSETAACQSRLLAATAHTIA
jgi:hypothetical protein